MGADLSMEHGSWLAIGFDSSEQQVFGVGPQLSHGRTLMAQRVAGVGVGIFLLFFFLALSLLLCLLGSRTKIRWIIYAASTLMFGIVAIVLLASPKGQKSTKPPEGYDQTVVPLIIIMAVLVVGVLLGAVGMLIFAVLPTTYARPLSYHMDVLAQRS
ncbi:hypothetical protein Vretimale_5060 [Volvox reticuliferus]|uniref:Transmembrane protein 218 n=1 Tax=Volvox reticuliferus TaxID=1737510 RepID=A0A8J4DC46_9CHLO|nr:hypothetical protein Vretifemale_4082 [Volvox reticuliferus]GIL99994.1 hypothetical protein Vretimale_5060 [Volvox reticuliferus]